LLGNFLLNLRTLLGIHPLFAIWAVQKVEHNTRTIVAFLDESFDATDVENMMASKNNARLLTKR
jgi:hypothetical protein